MKKIFPQLSGKLWPQKRNAISLAMIAAAGLALAPERTLAARPIGVDVSNYQQTFNWTTVKNSGVSFAWCKATEDTGNTDAYYTGNISGAKGVGIPISGYHFAHPESDSPTAQLNHYWAVAGNDILADGLTMSPMLDMEVFNGVVNASSYSDWVNQFNSGLVAKAAAKGVMTKPAVYLSACAGSHFNSSISQWFSDIANYNGQSTQTGTPWSVCSSSNPWGGTTWNIWQYTDAAIEGDGDVFNGSASTLSSTMIATALGSTSSVKTFRADFDGDGKSDYAVWRPATGLWYVIKSSTGALTSTPLGQAGDVPVPGDYDGDGKTDYSVWRPSTGAWYVIKSSTGVLSSTQLGQSGDVPAVGDYDGDGKADMSVWRPSTGAWYVIKSSTGVLSSTQLGQSGDVPVAGDYDGDGKADMSVWRPSTGLWYVIKSSSGVLTSTQLGQSGDVPAPGDYDGDIKTDMSVWRPSTGLLYIIKSSTGLLTSTQLGQSGDIPGPGDYDGDGKTDISVWRPSTGLWYVIKSSTGVLTSTQLGQSGDVPTP